MLILKDLSAEVPDTNAFHWHLEELSEDNATDSVLMYGYNASDNQQFFERCMNIPRKIYFNNHFFGYQMLIVLLKDVW